MINSLFMYYAALGASDDVFHITLNGYLQFLDDFDLVDATSAHVKASAWDKEFIAIDSTRAGASEDAARLTEGYNRKNALNRQEWWQVFVRGATMLYVFGGDVATVSEAIALLFEEKIEPLSDPALSAPANTFRDTMYCVEVDDVLRMYEDSLQLIFQAMCNLKPITMDNGGMANKLATYANFRELLRTFKLVDVDCTDRDATLCFSWSKMLTINEQEVKSRIKMTHLSFEDFLDALARLAVLKALPTLDDMAELECADAGTFLLRLAAEDPAAYEEFLAARRVPWGSLPPGEGEENEMTIQRKVEGLIEYMIVMCQGGLHRDEDEKLQLTAKQVARFLKPGG